MEAKKLIKTIPLDCTGILMFYRGLVSIGVHLVFDQVCNSSTGSLQVIEVKIASDVG